MDSAKRVALIGNPNCGKSTLFNALTGARQKVGNWPGVTVERKEGRFREGEWEIRVVDLPGVYSLEQQEAGGLDEAIARDYLLNGDGDTVVNIVDAGNLERNLYLTVQLLEMGRPMLVTLNMMDAAREKGHTIDLDGLANGLGVPVLPLVAAKGEGVGDLRRRLSGAGGSISALRISYGPEIESAVHVLSALLPGGPERRWMALRLLEGDPWAEGKAGEAATAAARTARTRVEEAMGEELDILIADARYGFIRQLVRGTVHRAGPSRKDWTGRIDRVVLNRFLGIPIFLAVMYLLFVISFNGGAIFLDFFDGVAKTVFVGSSQALLTTLHSPSWLVALLSTSVGGAIELVATFIAPIGMTFLFLSLLEDSGYMARAAFVMDRFMRAIGLPGKAFVPMIVGFGCNVPAVMAVRTLEDPRERLVAALMQPFMSCAARLVIYMAFAAVFFRENGGQVVFTLYVLGIVMAILTAFILKRTALPGEASHFIMELPPYRLPTLRGLFMSVWERLRVFVLRVGKVIIIASVIVSGLSSISPGGEGLGPDRINESVLARVGQVMTPVFHPMGVSDENWPATVGLLSGMVLKEIVVGTLNGVYGKMGAAPGVATVEEGKPFDFWAGIVEAVATIPQNAKAFVENFFDPLGLHQLADDSQSLSKAAEDQHVSVGTLTMMETLFGSTAAAMSFLIFVLLYMPCVNTIAAIRRETGSRAWTAFAVLWGLVLAYGLAVSYYQAMTFPQHPASSILWIGGMVVGFVALLAAMRAYGLRRFPKWLPATGPAEGSCGGGCH